MWFVFYCHFIFHIANCLLCILYRVFLLYPRPTAHFYMYICRILLIQLLGCHTEINACLLNSERNTLRTNRKGLWRSHRLSKIWRTFTLSSWRVAHQIVKSSQFITQCKGEGERRKKEGRMGREGKHGPFQLPDCSCANARVMSQTKTHDSSLLTSSATDRQSTGTVPWWDSQTVVAALVVCVICERWR